MASQRGPYGLAQVHGPTFARRLREVRHHFGLTQSKLAERLSTSQAQVSRFENAINNPTRRSIIRLAFALGVTMETLLAPPGGAITLTEE